MLSGGGRARMCVCVCVCVCMLHLRFACAIVLGRRVLRNAGFRSMEALVEEVERVKAEVDHEHAKQHEASSTKREQLVLALAS